jgi:isoleucyl-tRNA synthetase
MMENADPWENLKFNIEGVTEVQRRFFGTITNTYSFFALYANLDGFNYSEPDVPLQKRTESDRWILSKLNSLIKKVDDAYNDYEPTKAARFVQNFAIDDLSNWYVRLNRKRFWKGEYNEDKMAAYQTLYTCLHNIAGLIAPIAPFYAELLFGDLNNVTGRIPHNSIHLTDFPAQDGNYIDHDLEEKMYLAQTISSLVHSLRKKHRIKVRQPLSRILIPVLNDHVKDQIKAVEALIISEVNVKAIEYIDDTSGILIKKIKPNFAILGKRYGKLMKEITQKINTFTNKDISSIEKDNTYHLNLPSGNSIDLCLEDVEISSEDIPGWSVASENGITVALDVTISEELRKEGIARDVVNRIQNLRKEMGLDVQDKINIFVENKDQLINSALQLNKEYICNETQAVKLSFKDDLPDGKKYELDDLEVILKIEK